MMPLPPDWTEEQNLVGDQDPTSSATIVEAVVTWHETAREDGKPDTQRLEECDPWGSSNSEEVEWPPWSQRQTAHGANQEMAEPERGASESDPIIEAALERATAVMHGLSSADMEPGLQLGPTVMAQVNVEGRSIQALVDTGSPATIVALDTVVQILAAQKPTGCSVDEWKENIRERLEPSTICLKSYGGGKLDLVRQIRVTLSC